MAKASADIVPPQFMGRMANRDTFTRVAAWTIRITGGRIGFLSAFGAVIFWALMGPFFHFSEDWQLVINTGTTIVTFLMVFLIQNAQNRESKAVHLKLDELILAVKQARNELIDIEHLTEEQLNALSTRYSREAAKHHHKLTECFPNLNCEPAIEKPQGAVTVTRADSGLHGPGEHPHDFGPVISSPIASVPPETLC